MNNPIITRNTIFQWFIKDNQLYPMTFLIHTFNLTTDEELAEYYHLQLLRKGYFYRV